MLWLHMTCAKIIQIESSWLFKSLKNLWKKLWKKSYNPFTWQLLCSCHMSVLFVATDSVSSFSSWSKESCANTSFSSDSSTKEGRYPEETEGKREDRHEDIIDESYTYVIHNAGNASNDTMHVKPPHCHKLSQTVTNCHKLSQTVTHSEECATWEVLLSFRSVSVKTLPNRLRRLPSWWK